MLWGLRQRLHGLLKAKILVLVIVTLNPKYCSQCIVFTPEKSGASLRSMDTECTVSFQTEVLLTVYHHFNKKLICWEKQTKIIHFIKRTTIKITLSPNEAVNWPIHSRMAQWSLSLRKEVGDTDDANHPKAERSDLHRQRHQNNGQNHSWYVYYE